MKKIIEELRKAGVFYVASTEGDQPRVRPFSSLTEIDGQLYICTNNTKACFAQFVSNPKVEISGMQPDNSWVRISGTLVHDDRDEARAAMLADPSGPSELYHLGDGIFEVFRLENAVCTKYSFTAEPIVIQ